MVLAAAGRQQGQQDKRAQDQVHRSGGGSVN
jgi:hypothetical protein